MSLPGDAVDVADLRALADGGTIREDVYRKIFFLQTAADTPFTNLIGTDTCESDKTEWVTDDIPSVNASNAVIEGSNPSSYQAASGTRVSNRTQESRRALSVTSRARNVGVVGSNDQLMFETDKALKALRQDVEAAAVSHQAGVIGVAASTAQKAGGFSAWVASNDSFGSGGASGGYNSSTHIVDAPTVGGQRALSWAYVTAQMLATYNSRGNVRYLMTTPQLQNGITASFVAGTIKGAVPSANIDGERGIKQVGNGYFGGFISALGQLVMFVPNRTMQAYDDATTPTAVSVVDVLLIDPDQVAMAYLDGYRVTDLGQTSGLRFDRDVTVEWTTKVYREDAHAVIRDINPASAVTA